jgi:hypothetical protein
METQLLVTTHNKKVVNLIFFLGFLLLGHKGRFIENNKYRIFLEIGARRSRCAKKAHLGISY